MKFLALFSLVSLAFALPSQKRQSCANPTVRKEWRSLTQDQRSQFHQAVKCLQTKPSNVEGESLFDRYSSLHVDMYSNIHYVAAFLPWHRYLLAARQQGLVDCGYTGPFPYWDWTIDADANNMSGSKIFDPVVGFGGNGVPSSNGQRCVQDGPYGVQSNFTIAYPENRCLQRKFNMGGRWRMQGSQHTSRVINNIMQNTAFTKFQEQLEEGPHDAVHNEVASDMAASFSPDDVLFFLHHCNVDRIWALWQKRDSSRLQAYGGNTVQGQEDDDPTYYPLATLSDPISLRGLQGFPDVQVQDVINTQSGALCYTYDQ